LISGAQSGKGESGHALVAASSATDDRNRVLKHGDTFAVFDHMGDIRMGGLDEQGLYHDGTRYLSHLELQLEGMRPFFLNSTIHENNDQMIVSLTNPDFIRGGQVVTPLGILELSLNKFLWQGTYHQRLRLKNYGLSPQIVHIGLIFGADYADIFEVRGMTRKARGVDLAAEVGAGRVVLGYRGLDDVVRRSVLDFSPPPTDLRSSGASYTLALAPREEVELFLAVRCTRESETFRTTSFEMARNEAQKVLDQHSTSACRLNTNNSHTDAWLRRAAADLQMMITDLPTGSYPYAGIPWFNAPFGRDAIITAMETLWLWPEIASGVLAYLAKMQATQVIVDEDAEPGKILHETRNGEMAALKEMPFGRYYGSADATPLYVMLAGAYYERTGDLNFIRGIWPNIQAALAWMDQYGDRDGDGFIEYQRQTGSGLKHQAWKDSDDSVFHADGTLAEGPFAVVEVQAYAYAARRAAAALASALGEARAAELLLAKAEDLRLRFETAFWCEELDTYAIALDGKKNPCRIRSSNAGHCLFAGIADPERAARVARTLTGPDSFSGWGVRTIAQTEARFNPMAYHNGSIWPHDTALIAAGLTRYGHAPLALQLWDGLFEAGLHFDLHRMPELFCGFARQPSEGPVLYPVACSPQAWSAASVFLLLQACLGLSIDGRTSTVSFTRPELPHCLEQLAIDNLRIGGGRVDLLLLRHENDVGVNVVGREGEIRTVVIK
jgi:glycogen debranching enzyme